MERLILVDKKKWVYEGIFSVKDLYKTIDKWLTDHGYERRDVLNSETVSKTGRTIKQVFEPWKRMSDYGNSFMRVIINMENVTDVIVNDHGREKELNQGKITFTFDAIYETDFEHKWENRPGFFFIRVLFDKYLFEPFKTDYPSLIMNDFTAFTHEIQAHLRLYKYVGENK